MNELKKRYKELKFTDDFMFAKVLVNNPEICRRLLELLLEIKIKSVSVPEKQKTIEILSDSKGIRLDVYVDDEEGTVYNIEMQTTLKSDLPKRSRYYQGMIDLNLIERGAKYKELKLSYVIFICMEDPFQRQFPVYRFENICIQDKNILLKDEAIKVFINADGDLTGVPEELADFLRYLKGDAKKGELAQMIEQEVKKARAHEGWEAEYMTLYLRDQENQEIGMEKGLKIGLERGRAEGEARGRAEGEARLGKLVNVLLKQGKTEEIAKVTSDEKAREEYYAAYQIK